VGLSVITVCMNRREHLLVSAPELAAWPHHSEHLIVDWSSREPLRRDELPGDRRLRLLRVEGESRWNLCRAYNFALARAGGSVILKLDADAWPTARFDPTDPALRLAEGGALCAFGSGPEGRKGQLLIDRALLTGVGGFHELMVGYGFDDKDLQARLRLHTGQQAALMPTDWLAVIAHGDEERAGQGRAARRGGLEVARGEAAMRATRLANRLVAAHCPWGAASAGSRYREQAPGLWQLEPGSLPRPPAEVAAELEHARRMTFWGAFLAIPELGLEVMPFSLFPPERGGRWSVRWWHRLWWQVGRRLTLLPVQALAAAQALLTAGRRARA
jgi:hypothetical protein